MKKLIISIAVIIIIAIGFVWWQWGSIQRAISIAGWQAGLTSAPKYTGPVEKITMAVATQPISALVYIAKAQNYFQDQGLDVTFQPYSAGKDALRAVVDNKADLGTVADTPFAIFSLNNMEKVDIADAIGTSSENLAIIARKDKGILNPTDLKGKKIGVTLGTNAQYFLDLFLQVNGIKDSDVAIVNFTPAQTIDALVNGQVDAFCAWNPNLVNLQKQLGDNGVTFNDNNIYSYPWVLVATQDYINQNKGIIERVLTALVAAENFAKDNPAESQKIVAEAVNLDLPLLQSIWGIYQLKNTLSQAMLLSLGNQAEWAIENKLTTATEVPNYLDYIYTDALESVKPEAVTIIK